MFDLNKSPFMLGFDDMFNKAKSLVETQAKALSYPPFNIRKEGDNKYVVEMAVAGYGENEISIEFDKGVLKVEGEMSVDNKLQNTGELVHKGISTRPFERKIVLHDSVEVKNAELYNGVLRIFLENMANLSNPKKVPINSTQSDVISK